MTTQSAVETAAIPDFVPLPPTVVGIEKAWHNLMRQLVVVNVGYAHGVKVQRRNLRAWMGSR